MRLYILANFIFSFLTGCKESKELPPFNMADEFNDHYEIFFEKDFSRGYTWIDSGFLFSHISHKKYDIKKIHVADIKRKINYGSFNWPDKIGSYYFSCGYWNNKMIYLNSDDVIYTVDLVNKMTDTIYSEVEFNFMKDFVMSGNNLISINNVYGIEAINVLSTNRRMFLKPYRGFIVYTQNNISLPVSKDLNLVGGTDKRDSTLTVYAIDSSLQINWSRDLKYTDFAFETKSYSFKDFFLLKSEKTIECLSKNGSLLWSKTFDRKILNYFPINEYELVIVFTDFGNEMTGTSPDKSLNFDVCLYDISTDSIKWQRNLFYQTRSFFVGKEYILGFDNENLECNKIDLKSGSMQKLPVSGKVEVFRDKITGENYLLYGKTLFW